MKGLLLINLGSPDSTKVSDVKKYLDEFLMDKRVIGKSYLFRYILVKGIIFFVTNKEITWILKLLITKRKILKVFRGGFEPPTKRFSVFYSTIELPKQM